MRSIDRSLVIAECGTQRRVHLAATTMSLPPSTVRSCAHGVVLALVGAAQRKQPPLLLQAQQAQQDEVRLCLVTSPGHDWLAHHLRRACRPVGPMGPAPPTRGQHAHKV